MNCCAHCSPTTRPDILPTLRTITSFVRDDEGQWVAQLGCGHQQHVRHQPPWINRPWVVTAEGRAAAVGGALECGQCVEVPAPATVRKS